MIALQTPVSSHSSSSNPMPALPCDGPPVDPRSCVEPGTGLAVTVGAILAAVPYLFLVLVTYGIALLALLLSPLFRSYFDRKAMALIKGSGVRISARQLPEIHKAIQTLSTRLGLPSAPEAYLVESNVINAAAVKLGKKQVILLTDDMIDACLRTGNPHALVWILGHEIAHVAHKHNGIIRLASSRIYRKLSRLDEYTADRTATALVNHRESAAWAVLVMLVGPQLLPHVNIQELAAQAQEVAKDKYSQKAERILTHPMLLNRLFRILNSGRASA